MEVILFFAIPIQLLFDIWTQLRILMYIINIIYNSWGYFVIYMISTFWLIDWFIYFILLHIFSFFKMPPILLLYNILLIFSICFLDTNKQAPQRIKCHRISFSFGFPLKYYSPWYLSSLPVKIGCLMSGHNLLLLVMY